MSTGQPHEGSGYASAKVLQMAWHRIQHARSRVRELDESKTKYMQAAARQQRQGAPMTPTAVASPSPGQPTQPGQTGQPNQSAPPNLTPITGSTVETTSTPTSIVTTTSS